MTTAIKRRLPGSAVSIDAKRGEEMGHHVRFREITRD